jgi:hypothetical protein
MAEPQVRHSVDKNAPSHHEDVKQDTHQVAEHGHAATDQYALQLTLLPFNV